MKRFAILFLIAILLASCAYAQDGKTLSQWKAHLDCIRYEKGMGWNQISEKMGSPDIAPLPEPGTDLTKNTRGFRDRIIIFYTEMKETREGEKVRFHEVVSDIEICKEK